ncbi:MAG: recombinase family protein [Acidobacteriia bacterium]|nr:recombinase family protein [Terriglobia bacterium]
MSAPQQTCDCVWRGVFREVMTKVRQCAEGGYLQPIIMNGSSGAPRYRRSSHVRKREEFAADVYLTAVRTLTDPTELNLFKYHYLYGADWKLCCKRLGLPYQENKHRKLFFDRCYRVEQKLGKVFLELKPFTLWPPDEYFHVVAGRSVDIRPIPIPEARHRNGVPLRPPLGPRPVPVFAPDSFEDVKQEIRAAFAQGQTLAAICNDLNRRGVLPKQASRWHPAGVFRITGPRAPAPAPAVTPVPFDIGDGAAVARHARNGFGAGRSLDFLAAELTRMNVPAPKGNEWRGRDVRNLLLTHPREPGRFKRAA